MTLFTKREFRNSVAERNNQGSDSNDHHDNGCFASGHEKGTATT